jgi:hypothetical protein
VICFNHDRKANTMAEPVTSLTPAPTQTIVASQPFSAGVQLQPTFDVIEALPPVAADKLRALRQRSVDAHAVIPMFEDVRQASMSRVEAENALRRLTSHPQDGGFGLEIEDRRVIEAQKRLDKATADFRRLQELQEVRSAAWQTASAALANVESWLRDGRPHGTALEVIETEVKLTKGEGVLDAVERVRRRVRELRADLHRIDSAPYPSSYAKAQMRAQIEALAMQGAPSVSSLIELDGKVEFATTRQQSQVFNAQERSLAFTEITDAVATLAWLLQETLIKRLDAEIATEADDGAALTHETRQQRTAEVMSDLLATERDECALVFSAQAQGLPVEHRRDVNVIALLGLKLVTLTNGHAPETSWQHAYDIVRR